jgi:hypothetical protein
MILVIFELQELAAMDPHESKEAKQEVKTNNHASSESMVFVNAQDVLNWAVGNNNVEYVEKALKAGASLEQAFPYCRTTAMLHFLVQKGLRLSSQQRLDWAVFHNDEALAFQELKAGASPYKALCYCRTGAMLTTLISGGMMVDGIMPDIGVTPLYFFLDHICQTNPTEQKNIINILLLMGADPDVVIAGIDQSKPIYVHALQRAVYLKRADLVELLIQRNAALNIQDQNGLTPLHIAVHLNAFDIMKLLVDSGASLDIKDKSGATSYDVAIEHERYDFIEYLDRARYLRSNQIKTTVIANTTSLGLPQIIAVPLTDVTQEPPQASSTSSTDTSAASSYASTSSTQSVVVIFSPNFNNPVAANQSTSEQKESSTVASRNWLQRPSNLWRSLVNVHADSWESQIKDHSWKRPQ